jgi:hypothetical protein
MCYSPVELQCPERKGMREGPDYCKINNRICALETEGHCRIYEEFLMDVALDEIEDRDEPQLE